LAPIGADNPFAGQKVDVGGGVEGDHIGFQTVGHGPRLGTRPGVGLVHFDVFASGFLVLRGKGDVDFFVELARHVVGDVEQAGLGKGRGSSHQSDGADGKPEGVFHGVQRVFEGMRRIVGMCALFSNEFVFGFICLRRI